MRFLGVFLLLLLLFSWTKLGLNGNERGLPYPPERFSVGDRSTAMTHGGGTLSPGAVFVCLFFSRLKKYGADSGALLLVTQPPTREVGTGDPRRRRRVFRYDR